MSRIFFYPDGSRYVLFTDSSLSHMYSHAQKLPWQREAGGEVFSYEPHARGLIISSALGPNSSDYRRRRAWKPDLKASDKNRQTEFVNNRYPTGLWHTHPERQPKPSGLDQSTTWDYLNSFNGDLSRYLMVIIGNRGKVPNMSVWLASYESGKKWLQLREVS